MDFAIAAGAAGSIGLIAGMALGGLMARRKFSEHYDEVRDEIARLRNVAERKLSGDDPNLETLLRNFNDSVRKAMKAAEALEAQEKIIRKKTEGGREVIASSRQVARLIDEFTGAPPEPPAPKAPPKVTEKPPAIAADKPAPEKKRATPLR